MQGADPAPGWDCHVHVFDSSAAVRPGHYRPVQRPLAEIESLAAAHRIGHLVLVQPSVYGTDASLLLRALRTQPGRHRGVVVVEPTIGDAELDTMHAAGVRGVRFNLVSPAGHAGDPGADLRRLAPRLQERGWHAQWYVPHERLPQVARWQAETGVTAVLDHLAGLNAGLACERSDAPAWRALHSLAARGAWIKLSGWYRLGAAPPYAALAATVQRVATLFAPRLLWGSDWPHTSFAPDALPDYASMFEPVRAAVGEAALQAALHDAPAALYG